MPRHGSQDVKWKKPRLPKSRWSFVVIVLIAGLSGCATAPTGTLAQVCGEGNWEEIRPIEAEIDKIPPDIGKKIVGGNKARAAWCTPRKV